MTPLPDGFLLRPFAHRGLHGPGAPENGLAAFRAAIARGYGIEFDVQPSADGVAMAFHDITLDRMTGRSGPVDAHPAEALAGMALRGGDGAGIPLLRDVLAEVAGRVPLLIEVKDRDGAMGPGNGALEDAVIAALEGYGGPVAVMSFNPHAVAHLAARAPHIPRGLVTAPFHAADWPGLPAATRAHLAAMPDLARTGAAFLSHQADDLHSPHVARARAAGRAILCWTVRSPEQEAAALRHADAVTFEGYLP
jgi:glycerophosphoryl diester phosphodiesterase